MDKYIELISAIKQEKKKSTAIKPQNKESSKDDSRIIATKEKEHSKDSVELNNHVIYENKFEDTKIDDMVSETKKDSIEIKYRVLDDSEKNVTVRQIVNSLSWKDMESIPPEFYKSWLKENERVGAELPFEIKKPKKLSYGIDYESKDINKVVNEIILDYKDNNDISHSVILNRKNGVIIDAKYASGEREGQNITVESIFRDREEIRINKELEASTKDGVELEKIKIVGEKDSDIIINQAASNKKDNNSLANKNSIGLKESDKINNELNDKRRNETTKFVNEANSKEKEVREIEREIYDEYGRIENKIKTFTLINTKNNVNIENDEIANSEKEDKQLPYTHLPDTKSGAKLTYKDTSNAKDSVAINSSEIKSQSKSSIKFNNSVRVAYINKGLTAYTLDSGEKSGGVSASSDLPENRAKQAVENELAFNRGLISATAKLPVLDFNGDILSQLFSDDLFKQSERYQEQILYARGAKKGYYPQGTYAQITKETGESFEAIAKIFDDEDGESWNGTTNSIISGVSIANSLFNIFIPDGPRKNMANTLNDMRFNLLLKSDAPVSPSQKREKDEVKITDSDSGTGEVVEKFTKDKKKGFSILIDKEGNGISYAKEESRDLPKIGSIYVMPPVSNLVGISSWGEKPLVIPLQNNLTFQSLSRAASYNRIQFFGRIGEIKQFANTNDLRELEVTTEYFVENEPESDNANNLVALGKYTMRNLQDIELMYRSLVFPAVNQYSLNGNNEQNEKDKYYYYTRPPIVNIVLGEYDNLGFIKGSSQNGDSSLQFKNLFTEFDGNTEKLKYKNFVVTSVDINKDQEKFNYYVNKMKSDPNKHDYYDTMGFIVTLSLLEVDENYLNSMPTFNTFYNVIGENWSTANIVSE